MYRRSGAMWRAGFLALSGLLAAALAGPLGPLPTNITSLELGIKEGSCSVGDVVYMPGDEFVGSSPCERCSCDGGAIHCAKQRCEPRPGCKALHRPDHCCPTYQCECEQEGRVYGNGEKLVDPADPCRVCYCQGGEVVCRRIACFVRDDCQPRLVPGRCCPEYDNCPLRGVTSIPGMAPTISSTPETSEVPAPVVPKENIEQKITIKEITPVSEIPVITEVKIKEILPSPSIEVAEYSSSKSPLIPREATTEKIATLKLESTETPVVIEIHKTSVPAVISSVAPEITSASESLSVSKNDDANPSKISLSTQDSINSEIYPSNLPSLATLISSSSSAASETPEPIFTKSPIIIEEEEAPIDHNPAFPPLPDDLSVLANHDDEIVSEQNMDSDHVSSVQEAENFAFSTTSSHAPLTKEIQTTTQFVDTSTAYEKTSEENKELTSIRTELTSTATPIVKENSMLNLRSAIPTEILNSPSFVPEEITGELDEIESTTTSQSEPIASTSAFVATSTTASNNIGAFITTVSTNELKNLSTYSSTSDDISTSITTTSTVKPEEVTSSTERSKILQEQTTSSIVRSNIATEVTSHTEISSLPVETSDQNPHEAPDNIVKDKIDVSTLGTTPVDDVSPTKIFSIEPEVITVSKTNHAATDNLSTEIIETTEFVLTTFGSSESATDAVELIKISPDTEKSAAFIEPAVETKKNSVLTDLINLVGDVASISDHTDETVDTARATAASTVSGSISDSEELIPVNAGYKSKNRNWNLNSITEIPPKSKNQAAITKQKVIEIEDEDETESITDHSPPNDRVEPTTRRPIIDNVTDDMVADKTNKTDIEIIKQTYVPTAGSRPTKVVLKQEKSTQDTSMKTNPTSSPIVDTTADLKVSAPSEVASVGTPSEVSERRESLTSTASSAQ
ncbi:uncharacterized protein LOC106139023 [Amyelois transitella]|uniref:uncharacterized protein LOC106139023 n=1 Tax=Amyelois transitella TaxID=680683 RepID=UPI00298F92F8|nr:uncharacterized protein LOC106139023 [Amyelois transitella]